MRCVVLAAGALTATLIVALGAAHPAMAKAAGFSDVPEVHLYHVQIETLGQLGIIEGFSDGTFRSEMPITRLQFAHMIKSAMHTTLTESQIAALGGIPVTGTGVVCLDNTATAAPGSVLSGAVLPSMTKYWPYARFTLGQMITMATQAAGRTLAAPPASFSSAWGDYDPVHGQTTRIAEYNGLLRGLVSPSGSLEALPPWRTATRGQAAALVFNLMGTDPADLAGRFLGDADDLVRYFRSKTGGNDGKFTVSLETLAGYYITYGDRFGLRADMAWAQMIHETGYGQYGGAVSPAQNNMAGIGATGGGVPGNSFATAELGVIAQYAHLAWYVFPDHVSDPYCVKVTQPADGPITTPGDPRHFVQADGSPHKGTARTVYDLSGTWATNPNYGVALQRIAAGIEVTCGVW
jgi:hypothetical protein